MKRLILILLLLISTNAFASDYHMRNQNHRITVTVTDAQGNPVTGETVRLQIQRVSDDAVYDFNSNSFKFSGWTTRYQTLSYNPGGEYYTYTYSQDAARFSAGEYVMIVSNDSASYGFRQSESVFFDKTQDDIRINR